MRNTMLLLLAAALLASCNKPSSSGQPGESATNPIVLHGLDGQSAGPAKDATDENRQLAGNLSVSVVNSPAPRQVPKRVGHKDSLAHQPRARR